MKLPIVLLTIIFTILTLGAYSASADVKKCQPVLGGGASCSVPDNIEIDKFIQNPASNSYEDNIDKATRSFSPGQTINFRIRITNKTNGRINNIVLTDTLPEGLEFIRTTEGRYDEAKHTITYSVDLDAKKSRDIALVTRVTPSASTSCVANVSQGRVSGKTAADNTQFCLGEATSITPTPQAPTNLPSVGSTTKGGKTLYPTPSNTINPATGPETLALISLIPAAGAGLLLRKKSLI